MASGPWGGASSAAGAQPTTPKAVLRVMLATMRRCGCNFDTAWYMAVPVALTNMDEESARFAVAEFESERESFVEWYAAGVGAVA